MESVHCIIDRFSPYQIFWPKNRLLEEEDDNSCDDNSVNNNATNNVYIKKNESLQTLWPADRVYLYASYIKMILILSFHFGRNC